MSNVNVINDFNQNVVDNVNPILVGYIAITIEHFYDFNLEKVCCNNNDANE